MASRLILLSLLVALVLLLVNVSQVSASSNHHNVPRKRHSQLKNRQAVENLVAKPLRRRKSCGRPTNGTLAITSTSAKPTTTKSPVQGGGGVGGKPSDWPTATQAGAAPTASRTSPADPFLKELSKAYDNTNNALYNTVHAGVMTYYGQGLGACGDTYDDSSFTAAVSKLMYDAWPGAVAGEMNRNPICGPFVPGRKTITSTGSFAMAVKAQEYVIVGGDGLLNCATDSQCHIPLTATVKHGGKSIQVKIVDRCEACAQGDIDLTPTAFAALADVALGRTDVQWFFNKY